LARGIGILERPPEDKIDILLRLAEQGEFYITRSSYPEMKP
jgi:hypothetical protein